MTVVAEEHIRRLPKVELHCHVEGAARASTVLEFARHHGVALPSHDPDELFTFTDLNQFLSIYSIICSSLRTADDFRRIAYEACEDAVRAGVRYREMFFSPGFVIPLGVPVSTVWEGVSAGVREANHDLDIECRLVLDFDKPSGEGHALEMVGFAADCDRELLLGIGADSVERGIDHRAFGWGSRPTVTVNCCSELARTRSSEVSTTGRSRPPSVRRPMPGCTAPSMRVRTVRSTTSRWRCGSSVVSGSTTDYVFSTTPN